MRGRPNASGDIWRLGEPSTMLCFPKGKNACDGCELILPGRWRVPFLGRRNRNALRQRYGFSEYALHEYAKTARVCWIADHGKSVGLRAPGMFVGRLRRTV